MASSPCAAPDFRAFDIDIYDCPCGHLYGDHEYHYEGFKPGRLDEYEPGVMVIDSCDGCTRAEGTASRLFDSVLSGGDDD